MVISAIVTLVLFKTSVILGVKNRQNFANGLLNGGLVKPNSVLYQESLEKLLCGD